MKSIEFVFVCISPLNLKETPFNRQALEYDKKVWNDVWIAGYEDNRYIYNFLPKFDIYRNY